MEKKKKKVLGLIVVSILVLILVALLFLFARERTFVGQAYFDVNNPTTPGMFLLSEEFSVVFGPGDCASLCDGTCLLAEQTCADGCRCYVG